MQIVIKSLERKQPHVQNCQGTTARDIPVSSSTSVLPVPWPQKRSFELCKRHWPMRLCGYLVVRKHLLVLEAPAGSGPTQESHRLLSSGSETCKDESL